METIELQLDKQTLERALMIAELRKCTLEELIREVIEQIKDSETKKDSIIGMFADETDLIDQLLESAMESRESQPLRQKNG